MGGASAARGGLLGVGAKNACNNLVLEIISSSCFHLIFMFVFGKGILNHNFF